MLDHSRDVKGFCAVRIEMRGENFNWSGKPCSSQNNLGDSFLPLSEQDLMPYLFRLFFNMNIKTGYPKKCDIWLLIF